MTAGRTSTGNFRIEPGLKETLRTLAEAPIHREHGGSYDPGLLREQRQYDPRATLAFPRRELQTAPFQAIRSRHGPQEIRALFLPPIQTAMNSAAACVPRPVASG